MNKRDPVLFTNGTLVVFASVALAALILAFPGKQLFSTLNTKPTDIATLAYARAAFNHQPNDPELRFTLVSKLFEVGQITEAESLLRPLTLQASPPLKVSELNLKLKFRRYFEEPRHEIKAELKQELIFELGRVAPLLEDTASLEELADLCMQLGTPEIAAGIYRHIIELQEREAKPKHSSFWPMLGIVEVVAAESPKSKQFYITKQLNALLAANNGPEALKWADLYVKQNQQNADILKIAIEIAQFQADVIRARDWGRQLLTIQSDAKQEASNLPPCEQSNTGEKLVWRCNPKTLSVPSISLTSMAFINFVKHLNDSHSPLQQQLQKELAANNLQNSLEWMQQQLKAHPHSEEHLRITSMLAKTQGEKQLARELGERLLQIKPQDPELVQQQIDLELSIPDLQRALIYAQQWVKLAPEDQAARSRAADVALWAGDTDATLEHLLWLYQHTHAPEQLEKMTKIASALFKHELIANIYADVGQQRQLSEAETKVWFNALQNTGDANAGNRLLQQYLNRWPQHKTAWLLLMKSQELLGQLDVAWETSQYIAKTFGSDTELKLNQTNYLLRLGKIQEAWQHLQKSAGAISADDTKFWHTYATTAFLVGAEPAMLNAYQNNATLGQANPTLNYYLLTMLRQKQDSQQYRKYALQIFEQTHEVHVILDLINYQIQQQAWEDARYLLTLLDDQKQHTAQYWLIQAEIAGHFGEPKTAQFAIKTALQLDPKSSSSRSLLIWHYIAEKNTTELAQLLHDSETLARTNSGLWEAMAAGYRSLGQPKLSLPWYAKALQQWPERQGLLMGYADVLQEANEPAQARILWRYILAHFQARSAGNSKIDRPDASFNRRYAELVRLYLGASAGEKWLRWLETHPEQQHAEFSEYRIAWYLGQQRFEQAEALSAQAQAQGKPLPVWQRLALALHKNDPLATRALIKTEANKLSKVDEISALRVLGEDELALQKTKALMNTQQNTVEQEWLRRQASDLQPLFPKGWALSAKLHNVSELDIFSDQAEIAWSQDKHNFFASYQDQFYSASNKTLRLNDALRHEQIFTAQWAYRDLHNLAKLKAAASFREDSDYFSVEGNVNHLFGSGWGAFLEAGYNLVSTESAVFRVAGLLDKVTARVTGEFSKREYFSLNVLGQHYKTRTAESLGYGYGAGFEVGYRIFFEHPQTTLAIHGNWKHADFNSQQLPSTWQNIIDPNIRLSNIINSSYKEIGLDLRLSEGEARPFGYTDRSVRYFLEAGPFYSDPTGNLGAKLQGSIGTRLFSDDELSLYGYYASVQGGTQSIPSTALELRYSKRFD